MPYITQETRTALENPERDIETVGELNYEITMGLLEVPNEELEHYLQITILTYLLGQEPSYSLYNGVVGACICALLEYTRRTTHKDLIKEFIVADVISRFYARTVGPYEDKKIAENGDIPGYVKYSNVGEINAADLPSGADAGVPGL